MATSPINGTSSIDVNAIVGQLMQIEARPLTALAQKEAGINSRIAAVARVQGAVSVLQGAATRLSQATTWNGARAAVSGEGFTAAVTDSTKAALGTYSIKVTTLAASPALASGQFASSAETLGTGTLRLQVGGNPAKDIVIDGTNNTLAGIRDAINAAGAGVSAALVTDGGQVRLTLIGSATGAANGIKLTVQETGSTFGDAVNLDATGLSRLSFDPAVTLTPPATTASGRQMLQTRAAADAAFEVNGLALTATSNTVTGAIDGVTLDLKKTSADATTQLTISRDTAAMSGAVNDFIKAYNDLDKTIRDVTKFDAGTRRGAALNGDATVRSLQSAVRGLLRADQSSVASGDYARLSEVGIEVNRDGTLSLNSSKFDAATADPAKLSRLFTATSDVREEARGFGVRFKDLTERLVGSEGALPSRTKSLQAQIENINEQEERWNLRLQQIEARLRRQYTALDAQLAGLQGQSSSLANALAQLPGAAQG
jgi:flagellar hook-associated protein 2